MSNTFFQNTLCRLAIFALFLFCLNVSILSLIGSYDIRFGPIHLAAHGLFKPILMMTGCFVLALMVCGKAHSGDLHTIADPLEEQASSSARHHAILAILITAFVLAIYSSSVQINFSHHDWTHRHISAGINSWHSFGRLFTQPQADGFYRPLTFVSLWFDYRLFGTFYPGYHVQSIALHILNSLLVSWLAKTLGFARTALLWTGLLYAGAAIAFEPVLWPAARFDLLSTFFTLIALILAVRYFRAARTWTWDLPGSILCYALGIMNKESSYCFPLLVFLLLCTYKIWCISRPHRRKVFLFFSVIAAVTVTMILVRIAVYGNLGGYPASVAPESPHFKLGLKTFTSLLRVLPLSIFGINTTPAAPEWLPVLLILFAGFILAAAVAARGCCGPREYSLVLGVFITSIPVLNIAGWIGSPMQHSRYLYMPAVFTTLLLVSILGKVRRAGIFLGTYCIVNAVGATANLWIYRDMLARTETIADSVSADWKRQPDTRTICLAGVPEHPDGVFFFGSELVDRIQAKIPQAAVVQLEVCDASNSGTKSRLAYRWSSADRALRLISK